MLTHDQTQRIATATNALRPDWPTQHLAAFITRELKTRTYTETAIALTWIATDPTTQTPKRVLENGPWWQATRAQTPTTSVIPTRCGEHPQHRATTCPDCTNRTGDATTGAELARQAIRAGRTRYIPEPQRATMARAQTANKEATSE